MSISEPFIRRPIATSLLMGGILLVGLVAWPLLPVAPLPQVDFPSLQVTVQLPGEVDGLGIIAALREVGNRTPILILSALSDVDERIRGLRAGGDDYLSKPFAFGELLARLDALLRRAQGAAPQTELVAGDLHVDPMTRRVRRGERNIALAPREFKLLEYLMRHADQVVTRTMLLENVWDIHFDPQTNVIDVHISKLRQKIDADFERPLLRTVRNAGYMLSAAD